MPWLLILPEFFPLQLCLDFERIRSDIKYLSWSLMSSICFQSLMWIYTFAGLPFVNFKWKTTLTSLCYFMTHRCMLLLSSLALHSGDNPGCQSCATLNLKLTLNKTSLHWCCALVEFSLTISRSTKAGGGGLPLALCQTRGSSVLEFDPLGYLDGYSFFFNLSIFEPLEYSFK